MERIFERPRDSDNDDSIRQWGKRKQFHMNDALSVSLSVSVDFFNVQPDIVVFRSKRQFPFQ